MDSNMPSSAPAPIAPPRRGTAFTVTAIVVGVVALVGAAVDGFAGFVSTVAAGGFLVSVAALYRGRLPSFFLPNRFRAGVAVGVSLFVLVATAGLVGPQQASPDIVQVAQTSDPTSRSAPSPSPTEADETGYRTSETSTRVAIPFAQVTIEDPSMPEGTTTVTVAGVDGVMEQVYRETYLDGRRISRELVAEVVVTAAIDEVTSLGTYRAPVTRSGGGSGCDPNYSGCVPIASDVDCAGGSGNGPAYANGPVSVIGNDIYDLDRDGDGTACD